jgi:predicted permease
MRLWKRNREIAEEIESHLRMAEQDGVPRREFGNELLIRETTRDVWGWTWLENLARDLRYTLRQIRRAPGFATIAILTLALGLGAATAMFSVVNGVLLKPLPFPDPDRLYVAEVVPPAHLLAAKMPINARHFDEWRAHCRSCEQVALLQGLNVTLNGTGEPERLPGLRVSYNFFRTLGVQPALGRDFSPDEELPANFHVIILSGELWRTRFHSDTSILGRKILLDGEPHQVIGVMPPGLNLPRGGEWGASLVPNTEPLLFRPLGLDVSRESPGKVGYSYDGLVRLKAGVRAQQAIDEFQALIADFIREYGLESRPTLVALRDQMTGGVRYALWLLLGAVAAVLLIVCLNIGNLMLVRTSGRYREAAVRMALGAGRSTLFGLILSEAALLVMSGGAIGLLLGEAGLKLFLARSGIELPHLEELHPDLRVLFFALSCVVLAIGICGLIPAWRLSRVGVYGSLKAVSSKSTEGRQELKLREWMIGFEVALSVVLLITGGLLVRSFVRVLHLDAGFRPAYVITQDVSLVNAKYGELFAPNRVDRSRERFIAEALRQLVSVPGVNFVAITSQLPLHGFGTGDPLRDPDHPRPQENDTLANFVLVSPDYWNAMGIQLEEGRFFRDSDRGRKVAVLSRRAAQFLWPNQNPIGRHVRLTGGDPAPGEVIGIVRDVRTGLEQQPPPTVYEPYWALSISAPSFIVRTKADPVAIIGGVRTVLRSIDPDLPIPQAKTMEQIVDESVAPRRSETLLTAAFAIAALALASLGIYGVVAYAVARRTSEIGIRIALGARAPQLAAMVLREGLTPVLIGLAAGLGCALLAGRFIASQLYGVAPNDAATICAACAVLLIVAVAACWIPARRAMRIDPMTALRFE